MRLKSKISWNDIDQKTHRYEFDEYMAKVAQSRYVIRKVHMIIDACAHEAKLMPLQHQALIQIFGSPKRMLPVGQLADRLNVVPALASRLVRELEAIRFVVRRPSQKDRRTTYVKATARGEARLHKIAQEAHWRMEAFYPSVTPEERNATHEITAFYIGRSELPSRHKAKSRG